MRAILRALCLLIPALLAVELASAEYDGSPDSPRFVPNEILIAISPEVAGELSPASFQRGRLGVGALDRLASRAQVRRVVPFLHEGVGSGLSDDEPFSRFFRLVLAPGADIFSAIDLFAGQEEVEFAELNLIYRATGMPSDTHFEEQWALNNMGDEGRRRDADIDAPEAWELEQGDPEVLIAIVDTGISQHADLRGSRMRRDLGFDFVNLRQRARDDHGHGTYVAGIAAANSDNKRGVAGVCWRCGIIPIKVLSERGEGTAEQVANGIRHAADQGAHIISMSLANAPGCGCSQTVAAAINHAWEKGAFLVAASGNDGDKKQTSYPGASSRVMSVGASDCQDEEAVFSNLDDQVDLLAPGVRVVGLDARKGKAGYRDASGTSVAAPHVAGVAGLLLSADRTLDNQQIWKTLRTRGDRVKKGMPRRLNALKTVRKPATARFRAPVDECTTEPECPPGCGAEVALAPEPDFLQWVAGLRRLRDEVLVSSAPGRQLVDCYQKHDFEIATMLLIDSGFRAEVRSGLAQWEPFMRAAAPGGSDALISRDQVLAALGVLEGLTLRGSGGLRRDLAEASEVLEELGLFEVGTPRSEVLRLLEDS